MADNKKYNVFGILPNTMEGLKKDLSSINKTQKLNLGNESYKTKLFNRKKKILGLINTFKKNPSIEKIISSTPEPCESVKNNKNNYDVDLNFKDNSNSICRDISTKRVPESSKKKVVGSRICSICKGEKRIGGSGTFHSYVCLHCEGTGIEEIIVVERIKGRRGTRFF